jgi:NitT/TauT family transport system substrate-binding protein
MTDLTRMKFAPKGMGLNDFVALEEGFFKAEGLDVEIAWDIVRGTQSRWENDSYFRRPQDMPYARKEEVVQGACLWGTICNASAGMGRVVHEAYGESPWAIFVRADSRISRPEDLKDVPIAVGLRAGSHFNVPFRLEEYLPLEHIKAVNVGGFGARLKALLDGEVEAASLLPPQIDMANQLGLKKIIERTFHTLWWVDARTSPGAVAAYLRALQRAEEALEENASLYLHLWKHAVPAEFAAHPWDFSQFSRGEKFVYRPIPRAEFDEVFRQVERWGLDQFVQEKSFDKLIYADSSAR